MTTAGQYSLDAGDLIAVMTCLAGVFALAAALLGRRRRRPLPPPDDPRLRNASMLRDWKHRRSVYERFFTSGR